MDARAKRRLVYVTTVILGVVIVILAVLLLQQPIPISTVPNQPGGPAGPGGGNGNGTTPSSAVAPAVSTGAATGIGETTATLHGTLLSLGTAHSVAVGFQVGTSASLAGATNLSVGPETAAGSQSTAVTGLTSNTTYYVRAWAAGDGFATGTIRSFTTAAPSTTPPSGGSGNGHQVPPGWAHAHCPNLPDQAPAHGVRARCVDNETYGQLKKEGSAVAAHTNAHTASAADLAAGTTAASPGQSGDHRSDRSHGA